MNLIKSLSILRSDVLATSIESVKISVRKAK